MTFTIFPRRTLFRGRQWYFNAIARNGEIILQSEGYRHRGDCEKTVRKVIAEAASATIHYEGDDQ